MSGYTIIDVDTHVTETPDLWTSRAPARMRDRVPRVETTDDGRLSWVVGGGGSLIASPGLTATAGVGNMRNPPKTFEEMHPALRQDSLSSDRGPVDEDRVVPVCGNRLECVGQSSIGFLERCVDEFYRQRLRRRSKAFDAQIRPGHTEGLQLRCVGQF